MAINPKIKQKAEDIRKKIFGSEVRESLASGIEAISEDVEATIGRQDYVEEQFQNVIDETTDKDVISAPELIAARNGKNNLKTRLDDEHAQVTAQLQQMASGSPKNVYATLSDLQATFPDGDSNIYLVREDGHWYYWNNTSRSWMDGGVYQSTFVSEGVSAENIIHNGNFEGTVGWTPSGGTIVSAANELVFTITEGSVYTRIEQTSATPIVGHKYFVTGDTFARKSTTSYISLGGQNISKTASPNAWTNISGVVTATGTAPFRFYHNTAPDTGYVAGEKIHFKKPLVVDLTRAYGAGNEPTKDEFMGLLNSLNIEWFDLEVTLVAPMNIDQLVSEVKSKIDRSEIEQLMPEIKKVVTLAHFDNLRAAMESIPLPTTDKYELQIPEGTYDLLTMYSQSEIEATSFAGFLVPNNVSLVGTGRKENTIIKMEIPETWLPATIARVAPIANQGAGELKNITVIGKNCRYTVHDDYGYTDTITNVKNCTFIKRAGLGNSQAWGEGTFSGQEYYFEDTEFITEYAQAPYSTHNNLGFTKSTYHQFKRCKFKNASGYFGIRFITLDSGQIHKVDMIDCYVEGVIKAEEYESGISGYRYDLNITGTPETRIAIDGVRKSGSGVTVVGETMRKKNVETSTITKGTPVKLNNDGQVVQKLGSNSTKLIYGIATEDITPNAIGTIKTSGYLAVADTGLALVTGDLVGVVDGQLGKVTSGDIIGVANQRDFIKLTFS